MFSLLESEREIARAQSKLEGTFRREFRRKAVKNIGYPGGTTSDAEVSTDGRYWYWTKDHKQRGRPNPRRLNWLGLFRDNSDLQISVEVNVPYKTQNRSIAGFFGRDTETRATYLFHSGRVGGSQKGVGKSTFLAWSDERLREVLDSSGDIRSGVLVMPIEGKSATRSAIRYIDVIARFKKAVRAGDTETPEFKEKENQYRDFYSESRGRRKGKRSSEIDYVSRHGDVLDALHRWRGSQPLSKGSRLVKSVLFDLGVGVLGKELVEVYEIKTSADRSRIYTAIGQLMVHGTAKNCRRAIILPHNEPIVSDVSDALKRLDIEIIRFELGTKKATIL